MFKDTIHFHEQTEKNITQSSVNLSEYAVMGEASFSVVRMRAPG